MPALERACYPGKKCPLFPSPNMTTLQPKTRMWGIQCTAPQEGRMFPQVQARDKTVGHVTKHEHLSASCPPSPERKLSQGFLPTHFRRPGGLELTGSQTACMACVIIVRQMRRPASKEKSFMASSSVIHRPILQPKQRPATRAVVGRAQRAEHPPRGGRQQKQPPKTKPRTLICPTNRSKVLQG